jgi:TolA-binding protein
MLLRSVWFIVIVFVVVPVCAQQSSPPAKVGDKFKLAQSYEQNGDYRNAARVYQELYASSPNDQNFQGVVRSLSGLQQYASLLPLVEERLKKFPTLELYSLQAQLYWRTGKTSEADKSWETALSIATKNPFDYQYIATSQTSLRLSDKAITTLLYGRKQLDRPAIFADELSQLYAATGNYEKGISEVMSMFAISKNLALAQGRLSALMSSAKGNEFVGSALENAASSGDYLTQKLYLWFLRESKNYNRALEISEKIDRTNSLQGRELLEFADITSRDNQYDISLKAYGKVIDRGKNSPNFLSAMYGYARTLDNRLQNATTLSESDINEVIDRYRTIIAQFPNNQMSADCQYHIGLLAFERLNDFSLAEKELKRLIKDFKSFPIVAAGMVKLGELYIMQDRTTEAEKLFAQTVQEYSGSNLNQADKAAFLLAELEYYRGAIDSAQEHYLSLAARTESDASNDALERLTLIDQNKKSLDTLKSFAAAEFKERQHKDDEAIVLFEKVVEKAPESDLAEQSLLRCAAIKFRRNQFQAAREYLTKLLTKYPDTIYGDNALLTVGNAYSAEGNKVAAIQVLNDLLAKYPRSILLNEAREKIRKLRGDV